MNFSIRGKVAILVVISAAATAYLVAHRLLDSATFLLRDHELVDLGDESVLRGWEIVDQVDGLREDIVNLSLNHEFQAMVANPETTDEEIVKRARMLCSRYWNRHLRIDLVPVEGALPLASKVIEEKAHLAPEDIWFPTPEELATNRLVLSPIMRSNVVLKKVGEMTNVSREEPVVWVALPFGLNARQKPGANEEQPATRKLYVRIMMSLFSEQSSRQLFALQDPYRGELLVRPEETREDDPNDEVFLEFANRPYVSEYFQELLNPEKAVVHADEQEDPRVDRIPMDASDSKKTVDLNSKYYFIEGTPNKALAKVLKTADPEELEHLFDHLSEDCFFDGRVGAMRNDSRELRLLSPSREGIERMEEKATKALQTKFNDPEIGFNWWSSALDCPDIYIRPVRISIGSTDHPSDYLLLYSVFEDELSSSIRHEVSVLKNIVFLIAAGAGVIAFLVSMLFISPLKQMTATAQRVTEADPEHFHTNLASLARELPIRRRDEVGDIARASKRVFEEVISFHGQLEQRVSDRTRKLHKANFELEEAYDKLMSLHREKDAFVAKVSHDLRQPLTVIFMQIDDLLMSDLDEEQERGLQKIQAQAKRELDLVNDILDYQKIIMGADPLQREEINVCELLEGIEDAHSGAAQAKSIGFKVHCDSEIGAITADTKRVQQVLNNLVGNAVKFTKEGQVSVEALGREISGEKWVEFAITDSGRGMSPEEQAKAFTPFVSTRKDNPGGNGLGLSIARELVIQMGGQIGFISELGKGTKFTVMLPYEATSESYDRVAGDEQPLARRHQSSRKKAGGHQAEIELLPVAGEDDHTGPISIPGGTILIIDDDPAVRELLQKLLEGDGYNVLVADNGEDGLNLAKTRKPDAITLDVVMPDKDGWQVLSDLKGDPDTESIPVVMVSIMAKNEQGLALGVEDFLVKPVDNIRLSRVMQRVTSQVPQRNILIVDDDEDSRELLGKIIGEQGWQAVLAGDGTEAIEILQKTRPAAIILDLLMAGMDGFEFLSRISDDEGLKSIPVIVVTGKSTTRDESAFLNEHVERIIAKGETTAREVLATIGEKVRPRA